MQGTTLLIVVVIAIVVLVALVLFAIQRGRTRRLPPESRQQYTRSWQAIRTRFVEDPQGAVTEADRLVVALLAEQGEKVDGRRPPHDLEKARMSAQTPAGTDTTEGLRNAMLDYQHIVERAVGDIGQEASETKRPEVAS